MTLTRLEVYTVLRDRNDDIEHCFPQTMWLDLSRVASICQSADYHADYDHRDNAHRDFSVASTFAVVSLNNGYTFLMDNDEAGELIDSIGCVELPKDGQP